MDESNENYVQTIAKLKHILDGRLLKLCNIKYKKISALKRKYCEDKKKIYDDYSVKS